MGPRLGSRGRLALPAAPDPAPPELQWGHGSEAVEDVLVPEGVPASPSLQWGHGSEAVEDPGGPGREQENSNPASMGPRLGSRGRLHRMRSLGIGGHMLQWGHGSEAVEDASASSSCRAAPSGFNGATARKPWKTPGRGGAHCGDDRWRFNGATARKPWKTPTAMWPVRHTRLLQWGHGSEAVEDRDSSGRTGFPQGASMGPRLGSRGRRAGESISLTR